MSQRLYNARFKVLIADIYDIVDLMLIKVSVV